MTEKTIIGRNATVDFIDEVFNVPAKVDTGADSSAVWATDVFVDDAFIHVNRADDLRAFVQQIPQDDAAHFAAAVLNHLDLFRKHPSPSQ